MLPRKWQCLKVSYCCHIFTSNLSSHKIYPKDISWKALTQYFLWMAWCKYSYMSVVKQPTGKFMSLSYWLEGDSSRTLQTDGLPEAMVAIWEQWGADFSSFNLVTLGRVCPHLVARSSNGCNTLETLITTQAALRDTEFVKATCLLIAAIFSPLRKETSPLPLCERSLEKGRIGQIHTHTKEEK